MGRLENFVYEELRKNNLFLFKIKDLCLLLKINKTKAYNLVKALKKKNIAKNVGKNFIAFKDASELVIATALVYPSYISFFSALNYYGFSDQAPKKIFVATTKYSREINSFKYVTLSKKRFFGYLKLGDITIADREKAIIDSLLFPKYSGGIKEIVRSVRVALREIDIRKLINYALKTESKAVLRRLGFILENLEQFKDKKKYLKKIRKKIGKGYELLDPNLKRKNNLNKSWLLDVNLMLK